MHFESADRIQKTILDNGLTIISELVPTVRSVSVGVWINAGSRYENNENNGIAHFLEHIVFKGTRKRSALKIARALEEVGGSINAYTSKEHTVFYTHTLDSHLPISVNVLADLICNPLFREKDVAMERQVVLEEISAVKDTPDEYIFDILQEKLFPSQSIGFPILGKESTVNRFTVKMLVDFWKKYYVPNNIVVSAAGNIDHKKFVKLASRYFHFERSPVNVDFPHPKAAQKVDIELKEPVSQAHICAGLEGLSYLDENRFNLIALNTHLGGGMSSKLFQVIREKRGLAYAVFSFVDFFRDTGMISFYLGTDKRNQRRAVNILLQEIDKVSQKKIKPNSVSMLREQLKGNFLLGLESTYRRMIRLAKNEIFYGRQIPLDELISRIDAITSESLLNIAQHTLLTDRFNIIKLYPEN